MHAFKMNIYHKLKISYVIKLIIIKHAQFREFNDTLSAIWWYKTLMKMHFWVLITPPISLLLVPSNQSIKIICDIQKQGIHHSTSINLSK
jgi:hypothetical protein